MSRSTKYGWESDPAAESTNPVREGRAIQTATSSSAGVDTTYVGKAETGTDTAEAIWSIQKIVENKDGVIVTWADGNDLFDNVWNDVTTLSYS